MWSKSCFRTIDRLTAPAFYPDTAQYGENKIIFNQSKFNIMRLGYLRNKASTPGKPSSKCQTAATASLKSWRWQIYELLMSICFSDPRLCGCLTCTRCSSLRCDSLSTAICEVLETVSTALQTSQCQPFDHRIPVVATQADKIFEESLESTGFRKLIF